MRRRLLVCAGAAACLAACGDGGAEAALRLSVGSPAPAAWTAGAQDVVVGWAVRPEQLVACETAAHQLRAWRARFGSAVALSVVTVESEPGLVRTFLRAQRLSGVPVRVLPEREFRGAFGPLAEPMLFVVQNGRVHGRMPASRPALLDPMRVRRIELLIDSLVAGREPEAPRSSYPPIPRG
jgi:hypothetical protein